MSANTFKELIKEYQSTVSNRFLLEKEYGEHFAAKLLNHKIRKHCNNSNVRSIALYLSRYTDYLGYNVIFKEILDPNLYQFVKKNIYKSAIDNFIAYGYFKESENTKKYFTTSVLVEEPQTVEDPVSHIKVIDYTFVRELRTIRHTSIITSTEFPKIGDIAELSPYHPCGYGCWGWNIIYNPTTDTYTAIWTSSNTSD